MLQARHENILNVKGWTKWNKGFALIMDYMAGGNIWDFVSDLDIHISPLLQLRFCADISCGIAHIHNLYPKARLVHGDIKSENVLLTDTLRCKIADFGGSAIAVMTKNLNSAELFIQPSVEQITLLYASPEVLTNPLAWISHTHDIYSYSMVVYEILTRRKPIIYYAIEEYIEAVKKGQRPDIFPITVLKTSLVKSDKNNEANIIGKLMKIMKECWSQDPSDRPEMADVHKQLEDMLSKFSKKDQAEAESNARENMGLFKPRYGECETVSLSKLTLREPYNAGTVEYI